MVQQNSLATIPLPRRGRGFKPDYKIIKKTLLEAVLYKTSESPGAQNVRALVMHLVLLIALAGQQESLGGRNEVLILE